MQGIFDRYLKEGYRYEVINASLSQEGGILSLNTAINFIVPYEELETVRTELKSLIPGVNDVKFYFNFRDMAIPRDEIIKGYITYMKSTMKSDVWVRAIDSENFTAEEGVLKIKIIGEEGARYLNENAAARFTKMLESAFKLGLKVTFENNEDGYKETLSQAKHSIENPEKYVEKRTDGYTLGSGGKANGNADAGNGRNNAGNGQNGNFKGGNGYRKGRGNGTKVVLNGNRLMGKPITGEPVKMKEITEVQQDVFAEGEIFNLSTRDIRNDTCIVEFYFTDKSSSMCAKFFCGKDGWEKLSEYIKKGQYVKVHGNVEWDTYANALVLMAKDIELGEKEKREDNAEVKRVELHAHTKMSAMDGVSDIKAFVNQAIEWGHEAVAITDHGVVQAFPEAYAAGKGKIKVILGMEGYLYNDDDQHCDDPKDIDVKKRHTNHIIFLAKNKTGLRNLYELVTKSHIDYFYKKPRLPRSVINAHRDGIIIGSACEAGELFRAIVAGEPDEKLDEIASFYDYLEIQPLINNSFILRTPYADSEDDLIRFNLKVVEIAKRLGKPIVATCDCHYINEEDGIYRTVLMAGQGYEDYDRSKGLFFRTTEEMLAAFDYLDEETRRAAVIDNPRMIAEQIEDIRPVPEGNFPPKIANSDEILRDSCEKNAKAKYGDPLPEPIRKRLDRELESIIGNGYAVMYISAKMLVDKSMQDGYLVGSRGSVGSSFAATMSGITEVNPLPPHYICPNCKHLEWGDNKEYDCGVDMPEKKCPECGTEMDREGFSIPFETFLGFDGDKQPDIDLNFAGEYQSTAHKYVDEIFGAKNVYKAGTIGTMASKTAYGFVKQYEEKQGVTLGKYELDRLTKGCEGVKRTTGQHPGGIIVVPDDHDIHEFCPVQYPANKKESGVITTHFEYHSIDENLLKLDILGHESPSIIRHLKDITGVDPQSVPLSDPATLSIFTSVDALNIKDENYKFKHGSFGISEFGTDFVRGMLDDTKPKKFADLVRISGFSHGTDVWLNNAQEFITSGVATMGEAISTRDDIMNYLILKGLPEKDAFTIMEKVRKGKGLTEEREALMREHDVPEWYIESCKRIKYMFPRAHAVAYVMMSFRTAYFKVHYPEAFYATYFSAKKEDFKWDVIKQGKDAVLAQIEKYYDMGKSARTQKETDALTVLEVAYEMLARGYEFEAPSFEYSEALKFTIHDGRIVVALCALDGVGESAGRSIEEAYKDEEFHTVEDMQARTKANTAVTETLRENGLLGGIPEFDQLSLF